MTAAKKSPTLILVAMIVIVAMTQIDMTIVSIAAPDVQSGLKLSVTAIQWMVTGYLVALAALFALGGRVADVVGHRTMVIVGALVFTGASIACGLTPSGPNADIWLTTARIVQGAGAAFMYPAALAIVMGSFPVERRGKAVATFFAFSGLLTAVGPFVGSYLIQHSWRYIFFINVPVAIVGLVLVFVSRPENTRTPAPIDWPGAALIVTGMGLSVTGLQQASTWGVEDTRTLACVIGGAFLIAVFVMFERHRTNPLVNLRFFDNRRFTAQNAVLLFACAAFIPVFFFASMYAQVGLGWSASNAGLYILIFFGGFAPGVNIGGRLLDKGYAKRAAVLGALVAAGGFWAWASRLQGLNENTQWPWILVAGAGLGLILGSSNTDAVNQVPKGDYGQATGITQTARNYGASLGIAVLGTWQAIALRHKLEASLPKFGIPKSAADSIADALHGSGGGKPSGDLGPQAAEIFRTIRFDFAMSSEIVFRGLAVFMLVAAVVAIVGIPRDSGGAPVFTDADTDADAGIAT